MARLRAVILKDDCRGLTALESGGLKVTGFFSTWGRVGLDHWARFGMTPDQARALQEELDKAREEYKGQDVSAVLASLEQRLATAGLRVPAKLLREWAEKINEGGRIDVRRDYTESS